MAPARDVASLLRFQETGDREALLHYVASSDRRDAYEQVISALEPVLRALSFGEEPQYDEVQMDVLDTCETETVDVLNWFVGSPKADLRNAGLKLMEMSGAGT